MKHILLGVRDFLSRYAAVFGGAWRERHRLDPPQRTREELEFLPAHIELTDTPVSPAARWTMRTLIALFCVALLWACLGRLDIVAVASGKAVVGSRTKVLQSLDAARIRAIHVRDGQAVEAGETLIELDAVETAADADQAQELLAEARSREARFVALLTALDGGGIVETFAFDGASATDADAAYRLARAEHAAFVARRDALANEATQRDDELATLRELIAHLERTVEVTTRRTADVRALLAKHHIARHDVLAAEQAGIEAERDLAQQRHRVAELRAAIAAKREEGIGLEAEFRRLIEEGLHTARADVARFRPQTDKARHRDRAMHLVAPVDGTVQQLAVHTVGGVVTPAQALLAIVPADDDLEVEALVLNRDIGFVRAGQAVAVKIESFPYSRYGMIDGEVLSVSHDALPHDQLGLVYQARIRLARSDVSVDGVRVRLSAGMNVTAEIKTGQRRVIDYLLDPLRREANEAMRER